MAKREHGIYKYVHDNEVVYIGKTDAENGFQQRIKRHTKEHELFNQSNIYIHLCKDQTETDFLETILINAYKPKLNKAKVYTYNIEAPELEWIPWELYAHRNKVIKLSDFISCIKNGANSIKIGAKYYCLHPDVSVIVDDFCGLYPDVVFLDKDGIRIGGQMCFPTENLLLEIKRQIDYSLENYDTLKEEFIFDQCKKAREMFAEEGLIFDIDLNAREENKTNVCMQKNETM